MATLAVPLMIVSTAVSAFGSIAQGNQQKQAADAYASQLETEGGAAVALSQRAAAQRRREGRIAISDNTAQAAASGAGATDPTVAKIQGDIAGQAEYNALGELYQGKAKQASLQQEAANVRYSGSQAQKAGYWGAASSVLQGATSLYMNYGEPGFNASQPENLSQSATDYYGFLDQVHAQRYG